MVTTYRTSYACGGCNRPVSKDATYCPHCNVLLRGMRCAKCGFVGHPDRFVNSLCPKCGAFCATTVRQQQGHAARPAVSRQRRIERMRAHGKSPLACLLASFLVPGLGTIGATEQNQPDRSAVARRGIVIFLVATVLLYGGGVLSAVKGMPPGLAALALPVWLWGMVDAYRTARKWNRSYASPGVRDRHL